MALVSFKVFLLGALNEKYSQFIKHTRFRKAVYMISLLYRPTYLETHPSLNLSPDYSSTDLVQASI